jgi:hypothetical protein
MGRWGLLVAAVAGMVALCLAAASAAWASYVVTPECTSSGQTSPCGVGWYGSSVSVSWTWTPQDGGTPTAGCLPSAYVQDTSTTISCAVTGPSGQASISQALHVEVSTPTASVGLSRSPDANGWYNHPVSATVSGSSFSGIASCTPGTYSGPDSRSATVSGSCTDNAGKIASATSASFRYEASSPFVSVAPSRPPDSNGWYTRPVSAHVNAISFSGIASCAPSTYSGPNSSSATVSGSCTDNAGKSASATSAPFAYEGSGPAVSVALARPPDSNGWYIRPVAAAVSGTSVSGITSCTGTTYGGPDALNATVSGTCSDGAGETTTVASTQFRYEASTPTVSVGASRAPDSSGWYTRPVTAAVSASSFSGIAACTPSTYSGPDAARATVSATCTDNAGKSMSATSLPFPYEGSAPIVTVAPARAPDSNGWYNHPVAAVVKGSSFSGTVSCTPTTYRGPATLRATLSGSCTDESGKTVSASSGPFRYDASLPALKVTAAPADRSVGLRWTTTDVARLSSVKIMRAPGRGGGAADLVYSADGTAYVDRSVRNGVHYRYTFIAKDRAGNVARQSMMVTPGPRLLAPHRAARVAVAPLLRWTPVRGASYYNVQLYRGGEKILSLWPGQARLRLNREWSFDGHRHRLRPGPYRWYVWPGFGPRAVGRYGHAIGNSTFMFVRHPQT